MWGYVSVWELEHSDPQIWSRKLKEAKVWLAHGTTCSSFYSRALAIFCTFLEYSVWRTRLCSKINIQNIIQGFCFYLEDKAKKLTSWLQDMHSSRVVTEAAEIWPFWKVNSEISRLLSKCSVPKMHMIFCLLFHSVTGKGIAEIVKWDSYLEKMRIFFVRVQCKTQKQLGLKSHFCA